MGLFGKKKEAKEQKPIEEVMAQNVFGKTLLPGEKIVFKEKARRKSWFFQRRFWR